MANRILLAFIGVILISPPALPQSVISQVQNEKTKTALIGTWTADIGSEKVRIRFSEDGTFELEGKKGTFRIAGGRLYLEGDEAPESGYQIAFGGGEIVTVSGGDLPQQLKLSRVQELTMFRNVFSRPDGASLLAKLTSIAVILAVVFAVRLLLAVLKLVSRFIIESDKGVFAFLFSKNVNRSRTMHSLILDMVKYILYFVAFGFILSKLGVNYTTYLASLSVIGLAIGFGSQGLVQDVVTGFFLLVEGQFDVGDMVEISGQSGIVCHMGLRITQLENYQGQLIYIPNRNIALAGKFRKGALEGYIDVAVEDLQAFEAAKPLISTLIDEIAQQLKGVFISPPRVENPLSMETGEVFLRVYLAVWPGQAWVADQQIVPRIRAVLASAEIGIPGDRVTVFYHVTHKERPEQLITAFRNLRRRRK